MLNFVKVTVPATTANLGPGFDCIGAALSIYNHFQFRVISATEVKITASGIDAEKVSTDKSNLLYQSFLKFYRHVGQTPPIVEINIESDIPLSRGLGSSATAIVGGLVAANELAGNILTRAEIAKLAIEIEGHPDNVVPALLGNCQLSTFEGNSWHICDIPWHEDIVPVLGIPEFELSTQMARSVLPLKLDRADAIFNIARMGLLIRALGNNRQDLLRIALEDKLHQPYRQALIPGYEGVKAAALEAGAWGAVISGAGPTILALTNLTKVNAVAGAIVEAWKAEGISSLARAVSISSLGAIASHQ